MDEMQLIRLAIDLGATMCGGPLSDAEDRVVRSAAGLPSADAAVREETRRLISIGGDPLGDRLCRLRPQRARRRLGAFYTSDWIVGPMVDWALANRPSRFVDPGCGSGRFVSAALRQQPGLEVVAIDVDPMATLIARATLAVLGAADATVRNEDFTRTSLPTVEGVTAWVGNPPYVRHHDLDPTLKTWAARTAGELGHRVSGLAGLHVLFFLAVARQARRGDVLCYVTSAEWLDVGYGEVLRRLYVDGLGGCALTLLDPATAPFDDAMSTALIACGRVGEPAEVVHMRRLTSTGELGGLEGGHGLSRAELTDARRWSPLFEAGGAAAPDGLVRLGSLVRVSRGVATGGNRYFVMTRDRARDLGLSTWCRPVITDAWEILESHGVVRDAPGRRVLLCLPRDIDRGLHPAVDAYLASGEVAADGQKPVCDGYLCSHRRPWFSLGPLRPAPIVASYMARQAPRFALNPDGLLHLNIAHGLYPRPAMSHAEVERIAELLDAMRCRFVGQGRTYQGGLEKFEPREMEALRIPWSADQGGGTERTTLTLPRRGRVSLAGRGRARPVLVADR